VVERADRAPVATFHAPGAWGGEGGSHIELDEAAAHHAAVKRLAIGDVVHLTSGGGRRALGTISALGKRRLTIALEGPVEQVAPLPRVELWAPVGDRERMLWLGEKAVELGATTWRPIVYGRSRSVSPRGEGDAFRDKLRLRMVSALEQCGSAWLPEIETETTLDAALSASAVVMGLLLDAEGPRLASLDGKLRAPVAIALGPEGGLDAAERDAFVRAGWRRASLGANVLRFETAGIAALAVVRSLMADQ
jgi:16S rRNA (uracil1498-N3)-methyltransferase